MGLLDSLRGRSAGWQATKEVLQERFLAYRKVGLFEGRPADEAEAVMDLAFKHCGGLDNGNFHPYVLAAATMTHAVMNAKPSKQSLYGIALAHLVEFCGRNSHHLSLAEAKVVAAANNVLEKNLATPSPLLREMERLLCGQEGRAVAPKPVPADEPPITLSRDRHRAMQELINRMR